MNILFVCKYNRFRSKVAEALFRRLNKDNKIKVKSAGVIRGNKISPTIKRCVKEFGISIDSEPEGLSVDLLRWQDLVVVVADDVPVEIFENSKKLGKQVMVWNIKDSSEDDPGEMRDVVAKIQDKVKDLIKELDAE